MNKRQIKKLFKKCYVRRENVKNRAFLARRLSLKWKKCNFKKLDLQSSKYYRKLHPFPTSWGNSIKGIWLVVRND